MKESRQKWPPNMNPSTGYSGKGKTIKIINYSDQWLRTHTVQGILGVTDVVPYAALIVHM